LIPRQSSADRVAEFVLTVASPDDFVVVKREETTRKTEERTAWFRKAKAGCERDLLRRLRPEGEGVPVDIRIAPPRRVRRH